MELWKSELDKLNKSGRTWDKSTDYLPYRYAKLFCEECGKSLGNFDIVTTNLETYMYCANCVKNISKIHLLYFLVVLSERIKVHLLHWNTMIITMKK